MRPLVAALRALHVTFVILVVEAGLATLVATPLVLELERGLPGTLDALGRAQLLDLAVRGSPFRSWPLQLLLALGLAAVLAPLLQMAWLTALSQPTGAGRALGEGGRLWLRAVLVTLLVLLGLALLSAPFALTAWALHRALDPAIDARAHDLALLAALAPIVPLAFVSHVWHDLARARALAEGALRSVTRSARQALRLGVLVQAAGWSCAGTRARRARGPHVPFAVGQRPRCRGCW